MQNRLSGANQLPLILLASILAASIAVSSFITKTTPVVSIGAVIALSIFIIAFINTKASLYILIFSMLLSPEIMMSGMGGKEVAGRGVTVRVEDFLLIVIGISWFAKSAIYKEIGLFLKTPMNRPILAYVVVCFFSTTIGVMAGRVNLKTGLFFVLKYIEYYIIYFMVVNNIKGEKEIKQFMTAIFITCAIVSFLGIIQIPSGHRVSAPFEGKIGEPNTLGGYLVLILSFAIAMILNLDSKKRLILTGLCMIIIIPFLFTLSRSSWLSAVPMYIALFIFSNKKLSLFLVLILAVTAGYFMMPKSVEERFQYTFKAQRGFARSEHLAGVALDPSTSERIHRFKKTIKRFKEHPVFGWGITGAGFIDGQYNRILEETGIAGIAAFFWIVFTIFKQSFLLFKNTNDAYFKGLSLGMIAGLSAMLTHGIGGNTFIIVRIMEPFWFLAGMIICASIISAEQKL